MEPAIFALLALISVGIGWLMSRSKREGRNSLQRVVPAGGGKQPPQSPGLPMMLDEVSIGAQLGNLRGQPIDVVSHYVESVKQRWVLNQTDQTAAAHARFLKTKIEELRLFKDGNQLMIDLEALALEREKRLKMLQLENATLDDQMRNRTEQDRLLALRERKKLELEIAQLDDQIGNIKAPSVPPPFKAPPPTPAEERAKVFANIAALDTERDSILATITDPDMQQQVRVLYDKKKHAELEKIAKQ
jgi:hypothetical protein